MAKGQASTTTGSGRIGNWRGCPRGEPSDDTVLSPTNNSGLHVYLSIAVGCPWHRVGEPESPDPVSPGSKIRG